MGLGFDLETLDLEAFARSLEKDCQEGVKWEHRKLQWIREERLKKAKADSETH